MADIVAENGVIHTINRLIFPPPKFPEIDGTPAEETEATKAKPGAKPAASAGRGAGASKPAPKPKVTIGFKKNKD